MSRYRSARAVFAAAAVFALAGCGSSAGTSPAGSSTPAGAASSPAGATSATGGATPAASPGSVVSAGSIPFPVAVGNTWVYEVITNINNAHAMETKRVLGVTAVPGGRRVTMSSTLVPGSAPNGTLEHYIFYDNGQIGFPVNEAHGVSVVSSNGVVWPDAAGLASGRAYHSVLNIKLSSGQYETANVTVQGGGSESVSVPAGTYHATLVTMTMATHVGNFATTAVLRIWTTPGTGPVKSEEIVKAAGKTDVITTSALVTFSRQAAGS